MHYRFNVQFDDPDNINPKVNLAMLLSDRYSTYTFWVGIRTIKRLLCWWKRVEVDLEKYILKFLYIRSMTKLEIMVLLLSDGIVSTYFAPCNFIYVIIYIKRNVSLSCYAFDAIWMLFVIVISLSLTNFKRLDL